MVKKVDEDTAKQGKRGRHVFIILIAGIALIVIGYLVIGSIGVATSPDDNLEEMTNESSGEPGDSGTDNELVEPQ